MKNNLYLYNLILSSKLINYPDTNTILGPEASVVYYLFKYSKDLYINYPRIFRHPSVITDSYTSMNLYFSLLSHSSNILFLDYKDKNNISFKYFDYHFHIRHINNPDLILYKYNNSTKDEYNGVKFNLPTIEGAIAYCFSLYSNNFNIDDLFDACVLIALYSEKLSNNILLSYLLQLQINVKKVMKKSINHFKLLNFDSLAYFDIAPDDYKTNIHATLGFCHGG